MTEQEARDILGDAHFEWAMRQGAAWNANMACRTAYQGWADAYRCIERLVNERATAKVAG